MLALLAVLATSCSTTLDAESDSDRPGGSAAATTGGDSAGGPPASAGAVTPSVAPTGLAPASRPPGAPVPGGGRGSAGPARSTGPKPTAGAPGSGTQPVAGGTQARPPQVGRGVTATTVTVGVVVINYAGLQDVKGYNNGSPRIQAQAAADHVNRTGGIGGRKLLLEFAEFPVTSRNWATDEQAMCTTFTEDKKVFAVVAGALSQGKTFLPCLARHDTPYVSSAGGLTDDKGMAEFSRYHYYSGGLTLSRLAKAYVDGLGQRGFFGSGAKVGLVRVDDQPYARVTNDVLKPRLAARGIKLEDEAIVSAMTSLSDTAAQMPSIVLRFQQRGINRVMFLDNASVGPLFAVQAASQSYYPRYGLTSASLPNAMAENVPPTALKDAVGVGWLPGLDVFAADEKTPTAAADVCRKINVDAGQGDVSRTGQAQQRLYCDELFFLQRALGQGRELSTTGLVAGVEGLGSRFDSATTFSTWFGPGRHDGASATRSFAFVDACRCFRYASPATATG